MSPNRGELGASALSGAAGWARFSDGAPVQYATPVGAAVAGASRPGAAAPNLTVDTDGAVAFGLFSTMLFIPQLGTLGALLFVVLTGGYAAFSWKRLYAVFRPRAFLLIIPILFLFSTVWSERPAETLKYSMEFCVTVGMALLLSDSRRPKAVLLGVFLAFAGYMFASIAFGQLVQIGNDVGNRAFSGLNSGKNLLADMASLGFLISTAVFFSGIEDRKPLRLLFALVAAGAEMYAVVQARSAGALLGLGLAVLAFIFFLAVRQSILAVRATMTCVLGLCLIAAALSYRTLSGALIDAGARFFDKDPTLTGRTYLWQRAADLIAEKPVFGKGFSAFWVQGNTDAEGLWRYAHIASREGFNFHNTFIDLLVQVGWFGLVVVACIVVVALGRLIVRFVAKPSLTHCFWLTLMVYELVRTPIEYIGFTEFYYSSVMVFIALGSAFTARQMDSQSPPFAPNALRGAGPGFRKADQTAP